MIAFYSNRLNNHQVHLADELYRQSNHQFVFIELCEPTVASNKGSMSDYSDRSYLIQAWMSKDKLLLANKYCIEAEVCLFATGYSLPYLIARMKYNKLSFDVSERWLKKGFINILSPNLLKFFYYYQFKGWRRKLLFKLCCSGFAAEDHEKLHMFKNKCYKWGYFTQVNQEFEIDGLDDQPLRLMWCARFLKLKHPELPLLMAQKLKTEGLHFQLDYYGDEIEGPEKNEQISRRSIEEFICSHKLQDCVHLFGNRPNHEILQAMREHDILLFTSNRLEGWGAVVNEAMANGCIVIASENVGSAPYLIQNNVTGFTFREGDWESLTSKVRTCIRNRSMVQSLKAAANDLMKQYWNPRNAASSLLSLIESLNKGEETAIEFGPGSKA